MVYYSELLGKPIVDKKKERIGKVKDFCFSDSTRYAVVSGIIFEFKGERKMIQWKYISEIGTAKDLGVSIEDLEEYLEIRK